MPQFSLPDVPLHTYLTLQARVFFCIPPDHCTHKSILQFHSHLSLLLLHPYTPASPPQPAHLPDWPLVSSSSSMHRLSTAQKNHPAHLPHPYTFNFQVYSELTPKLQTLTCIPVSLLHAYVKLQPNFPLRSVHIH